MHGLQHGFGQHLQRHHRQRLKGLKHGSSRGCMPLHHLWVPLSWQHSHGGSHSLQRQRHIEKAPERGGHNKGRR